MSSSCTPNLVGVVLARTHMLVSLIRFSVLERKGERGREGERERERGGGRREGGREREGGGGGGESHYQS